MIWSKKTCFLRWWIAAGADDVAYLRAQLTPCKLDITVCRDNSGSTWAVQINGSFVEDDIESAAQAQLAAVGHVLLALVDLAGDAATDARDDDQHAARAMLQAIHDATRHGLTEAAEAEFRFRQTTEVPHEK